MPPPAFVSAPLPDSAPVSVSVVLLDGVIVLALLSVTSRVVVTEAVDASVPPANVMLPEPSPRLVSDENCNVPAETVVPPR